jgi:predicted acetyltransferase
MKINYKPHLVKATIADHSVIQNLARFYVYDMSRYCGYISKDWACPADGLYESFDFKSYFIESSRKAFLVKVGDELAGFVLIKKLHLWSVDEFFILAKFQGQGVAQSVAVNLWNTYKGEWQLRVIPENTVALSFWRKTIKSFAHDNFSEELVLFNHDRHQPRRYLFTFTS